MTERSLTVACPAYAHPTDSPEMPGRPHRTPRRGFRPHVLEPDALSQYIDPLYRAAWALCGSKHDAEDLVQETLVNVLKRPRFLRDHNELGYLLRALKNTFASRYRSSTRRPSEQRLIESDLPPPRGGDITARELMEAVASAPPRYRDAVIAIDLIGLSYREAAQALGTREATITTRLYRGRQHIARQLIGDATVKIEA